MSEDREDQPGALCDICCVEKEEGEVNTCECGLVICDECSISHECEQEQEPPR